jgi:hypothetical protein
MRLIIQTPAIAISAFILLSCGGGNTATESAVKDTVDSAADKPVYLEGLYATSTRLPLRQYGIENLFDGKEETAWSTTIGAGPDEGFILYFSEKQFIKEIWLMPVADTTTMAKVKGVTVYADGHALGYYDPTGAIKVDSDVRSLFVKIGETNRSVQEEVSSEDTEEVLSVETFNEQFAVGFSGIRIVGTAGDILISPPLAVKGSVTASSVLAPAAAYGESQLFDSRKEFVWAEGSKGGGENESLTFRFDEEQTITSIKIWNGYQRSQKHFESNARVKTFEIGLKDGAKTRYTLPDAIEPQDIKFESLFKGKEMTLTVIDVYPGTSYKDLVVSELLFFNESKPIVIRDDNAETRVEALIKETKGSVLENYLDRRLHNQVDYDYYTSDRSLVLRSNKTFVLYDHTISQDDARQEDKEVVADGNWEIVELKDNYAKVRVFGKLFNISETVEYYKGNTSTEFVKIFQDNLSITPQGIKGEKYIESFQKRSPSEVATQ